MSDTSDTPINEVYLRDVSTAAVLQEVLRQSEMRIADQLAMSTAADQRAMTFAGLLMVVFVLLIDPSSQSDASIFPKIAMAFLFVATMLSVYSARPTRLYGGGSSSKDLVKYLKDDLEGYAISGIIHRNDKSILDNDVAVKRAAKNFNAALLMAFLAFALVAFDYWFLASETDLANGVQG